MNTEHLYDQRDEAIGEIEAVHEKSVTLSINIAALIAVFANEYSCSQKSLDRAIEYATDALVDLIDDAEGPASRRLSRIEDEIGSLEEADLQRNSPVVL